MTNGEDVISSNWKERGNILRAKLHCHFCSTSSFSLTAALIRRVRSRFMRLTKYVCFLFFYCYILFCLFFWYDVFLKMFRICVFL